MKKNIITLTISLAIGYFTTAYMAGDINLFNHPFYVRLVSISVALLVNMVIHANELDSEVENPNND